MDAGPSQPGRPRVVYATIYPPKAGERAETFITQALVREYLAGPQGYELRVVIASAHAAALETACAVLAEFPTVPAEFWHLETAYAGTRAEEISFCKEELPRRLAERTDWDWLLFMDADVWTPLGGVPEWMGIVGQGKERRFVKVKYCLRNKLLSPHHTLGAYFHHRALLTRMRYWERVFPKDAEGRRRGAPDCYLHDYLEGNGCQKIVPERLLTFHFLNGEDAQAYRHGKLATQPGARALVESGQAVREALASVEETVEPAPPGAPAAEPPLVSAVMITGKCPEREPLARVAVAMFLEQTHPRKELIIVNHGGAPLEIGHPEVQEILVPAGCRVTLGDLRNLALCAAAGEWIIQWDDDDWHAPERMAVQLRHAAKEDAVLLRSQIRYNLQTGTGYVLTLPQGIDGTILHSRKVLHRYPSLRRAEDTEFLKGFAQRKPITNAAGLYVRFYHGANTWEEKHLMHRHTGQRGELHLGPADRALLLERVLPRYAAVGMEMGVKK